MPTYEETKSRVIRYLREAAESNEYNITHSDVDEFVEGMTANEIKRLESTTEIPPFDEYCEDDEEESIVRC